MLADQRLVAFVATKQPERARAFYAETLGLRLVSDDPFAIVFDVGGTMLRVQKVEDFTPHPFTSAGWNVEDAAAIVDGLTARGVRFERFGFLEQDARGIWVAPGGARIAWFKDPDGNVLSVAQLA
jgi:catechol 2,3-dioxygenase-like lactoylglutathione lyase family enzyme